MAGGLTPMAVETLTRMIIRKPVSHPRLPDLRLRVGEGLLMLISRAIAHRELAHAAPLPRQLNQPSPPDRLPCMPGSPSCRTRDRGLRPSAIRAHVDQHDVGAGAEYVGYL